VFFSDLGLGNMRFTNPKDYHWLCDECKEQLVRVTQMFEEDLMEDTDDEEAPCNFMYDHKMFCGGHTCKRGEK
jgi:hypothetical protein